MDQKLTLKLNQQVITSAKKYAASRKLSISRLVETYLGDLTNPTEQAPEISPFVKSISTGKRIPSHVDIKQEKAAYNEALDKKYQ
ncbi:MAG: hypothetical protein EAY75_11335 [Bacteroidetes bacterium]|nr:MAG: hypothetical protein EAY75_11335 [Bacteroidota bacterium]